MTDTGLATDTASIAQDGDMPSEPLQGINEVATRLGVTMRTLRFYEDRGLVQPLRVGATRVYSRRDVGRLQLILRGKRLGFTIRQITEFLNLYDADPQHYEQLRHLGLAVRDKIATLSRQKLALEQTLAELETIERDVGEQLARLAPTGGAA